MTCARSRAPWLVIGLAALTALASLISLAEGSHSTSIAEALGHLWRDDGTNASFAVRELRLPRVLCAAAVGAALAVSGALIQVALRNPLGDPGLTGVTAGASFGVALTLTALTAAPLVLLSAGVAGGGAAAALTFLIAGLRRDPTSLRLILAGIAVATFFLAATGAIMIVSRSSMQALYFWMVGGFINRGWEDAALVLSVAALGGLAAVALSPVLRMLRFDDAMAAAMGLSAPRWRISAMSVSVLLAAASVAVAGPIGFVGFVAPHLAALMLRARGNEMAIWLILSALVGAALLAWSDAAARTVFAGRVPAGALITIIGGAAFLVLARRGLSLTGAERG